jgi:hypothetical protein
LSKAINTQQGARIPHWGVPKDFILPLELVDLAITEDPAMFAQAN